MSGALTYSILQQKKRVLGFETYVAPNSFDRTAQPVDIFDVFEKYYRYHQQALAIYTVRDVEKNWTFAGGTSYRYGYELSGVTYTVDTSGGSIVWPAGSTKRWVIVNQTNMNMQSYTVPTLSEWVYCGNRINRVTQTDNINNKVKYIHIHSLNNLTSSGTWSYAPLTGTIHWSSNLTSLDGYAFYQCYSLTAMDDLPTSLTTVNSYAFQRCRYITGTLTLHNGITTIGTGAFYDCFSFTSLSIGTGVTSIGASAFYNCYGFDGTLTFPTSLTTIGASAFYNCYGFDGTLTITANITSIGEGAFAYTVFNAFDVSANSGYHVHDNTLYQESTHTAIHGLKNYSGTLTIESDTVIIGAYCYAANTSRTGSLTIPASVTTINIHSFSQCSGFTGALTIPNTVLGTIGAYAFSTCTGFNGALTIGTGVTIIGANAFQNCSNVTSLTLGSSVATVNGYAFSGMTNCTGTLTFPNSMRTVGSEAFNRCGWTGLDLGTGITSLGAWQLYHCPNITGNLEIPASLVTVGSASFVYETDYSLTGFTSITSSNSNYPAEDNVLYDIKTAGVVAAIFSAREYVGGLTLRTGTTKISIGAFLGSKRTGTLTLLSTVGTIETNGFRATSGFTRVDSYPATAPTVGANGLLLGGTARPLHVPTGGGTGYGVAPWTTAGIFTQPAVADL